MFGIARSSYCKTLTKSEIPRNKEKEELKEFIHFHIDLGAHTSNDMRKEYSKLKIKQSFSKKGFPYDNACIESFHVALKKEDINFRLSA